MGLLKAGLQENSLPFRLNVVLSPCHLTGARSARPGPVRGSGSRSIGAALYGPTVVRRRGPNGHVFCTKGCRLWLSSLTIGSRKWRASIG